MINKLWLFITRHWRLWFTNINIDSRVVAYTLFALLSSLLAVNNKILFIITCIYVLLVYIRIKSAVTTFIYAFFWLQIYQVGQLYVFRVIEPELLIKGSLYPEGRSLYFTATPLLFVLIAATFSLPFILAKYKGFLVLRYTTISYALFLLTKIASSISSTILPYLAVFHTLHDIFLFGFVLTACWFLSRQSSRNRQRIIYTSLFIMVLSLFFEFGIVVIQMLKRNIIGLAIESAKSVPLFGFGADENPLQFRPVGLSTHANILTIRFIQYFFTLGVASFLLPTQTEYRRVRSVFWLTALVCLAVILVAQSRTGYMSVIIPCVMIIFIHRRFFVPLAGQARSFAARHRMLFVCLAIIVCVLLTDRVLYTQYVFSESGGWNTRMLLAEEAMKLISRYPFLGVGTGMFIPAAFNEQRYETVGLSIMRYFPESVHNGYLLLFAENGGLALFLFALAVISFMIDIARSSCTMIVKSFIIAGSVSGLLYMIMQPYVSGLSMSVIVAFFAVTMMYEKTVDKKIH